MKGHWSQNLQFWLRNGLLNATQFYFNFCILVNHLAVYSEGDSRGWVRGCGCCRWQVSSETWHITPTKWFIFFLFCFVCYYPHTSWESVSAVCVFLFVIYFYQSCIYHFICLSVLQNNFSTVRTRDFSLKSIFLWFLNPVYTTATSHQHAVWPDWQITGHRLYLPVYTIAPGHQHWPSTGRDGQIESCTLQAIVGSIVQSGEEVYSIYSIV